MRQASDCSCGGRTDNSGAFELRQGHFNKMTEKLLYLGEDEGVNHNIARLLLDNRGLEGQRWMSGGNNPNERQRPSLQTKEGAWQQSDQSAACSFSFSSCVILFIFFFFLVEVSAFRWTASLSLRLSCEEIVPQSSESPSIHIHSGG